MKQKDFRETIQIAIPIIIGQLSTVLMTVMDNVVVGHLGKESLSAASLANSCYILIAVFAFGALNPIPAVVAEARGAQNHRDIKQLLLSSILAGLFQGVFSALLIYIFSFFMPFLGQPPADIKAAIPFMWILALSNIPMCVFLGIKGYFDGMERTNVGMGISILGLILNIFFNIGLVFGKFGFVELGLIGSAWATLISRFLMMAIIFAILFFHKETKVLLKGIRFDFKNFIKIIKLGIPMGLQIFFEVAAFGGAVIMIGWLPDAEVDRSAHQIAINMASITFMGMLGLSIAGSVRVGEAFGRKSKAEILNAGNATLYIGAIFAISCAILLVVFRKYFTNLYGIDDPTVEAVTVRLVIIAAFFQLFDGGQCIGAGLLRGIQDVRIPAIITFVTYILIWCPLAYWLGFELGLGVDGIWYAFIIALVLASITLNWRFFYIIKNLRFDTTD